MEQAQDGLSMEQQPAAVIAKLDEKFGRSLYTYEIFTDEGKSGGLGPMPWQTETRPRDRKGLWSLIEGLKSGRFTHVASFRIDRLYRNQLGYHALFVEVMKPKQIQFVLVEGDFDESNPIAMFTQGVLAHVAEYQRHQISDNIQKNLDFRKSQGYYLGTIPFGWRQETPDEHAGRRINIAPVESEKAVVLRIRDLYLAGSSEQAIANLLNAEGVPHKKSVGKWRANTVHLVLINPTHAGLVRQKESLSKGIHFEHRFYEESDFIRIQDRLERVRKRLKGVTHTQPFRLFSGIAYCGHCGKKLQGSFHTEHPGYRCLGWSSSKSDSHIYISAKALEELVVAELKSLANSPEVLSEIENQIEALVRGVDTGLAKRHKELDSAIGELHRQEQNIVDAIGSGAIIANLARTKLNDLASKIQSLTNEQLAIRSQLEQSTSRAEQIRLAKRSVHKFSPVWDSMDDAQRREAIHTVIERIDAYAEDDRKWISAKFVFSEHPKDIEVLRGAERYRSGKLGGVASLTSRELAVLKHHLDGANYRQIAKYFETTESNAHSLLRRTMIKLGASTLDEAAKMAEPTIRKVQAQLQLFGRAPTTKYSPKRLKVMEYQTLTLRGEGFTPKEIALKTGIHVDRVTVLVEAALAKLGEKQVGKAMDKLSTTDAFLPVSMNNRKRIG